MFRRLAHDVLIDLNHAVLFASIVVIYGFLGGLKAYSQPLPDFEVQVTPINTFSTKNGGTTFQQRNFYPLGSLAKCEATATVKNNTTTKQKVWLRIEYWPRNRATGVYENSGMAQMGEIELKPGEQLPFSTYFITPRFGQNAQQNPPEIRFKITVRKVDGTEHGALISPELEAEMEHRGSN